MKIAFLNPPFLPSFSRASRSPAVAKSATLYYPIFLSYAAGVADTENFDVLLIDAPAMMLSHEDVYSRLKEWKPDFCVIDTSTPSIENDVEVATKIKEITGSKICLVGTHVSALPEETLEMSKSIDFIAIHEYDYTVCDIAGLLSKNPNPSDEEIDKIAGIAFRAENGIKRTAQRPFITDLDKIPFVSKVYKKHLSKYIGSYFYGSTQYPVMTILTGRGCPYACSYCVYPQTMVGHKYRLRSVENVVDEMEYIKKTFPQVKELFIEDDTLTVDSERCQRLAKEIIRRKLKITWTTNSRADADFKTLKILKKAGLRLVCVGFESGDQKVLDNIGKKLTPAKMLEFSKDAKKAGVMVHGCFLVGNHGETKETLKKTLDLALKINPDTAQFYPIMVYPGTKAYAMAKENNHIKAERWRDWLTPEGLHNCVVSTPDLSSDELVEFCDDARKKFYLRPRYVLSKLIQSMLHPQEGKRVLRSAKTFFKYLFSGSGIKKK